MQRLDSGPRQLALSRASSQNPHLKDSARGSAEKSEEPDPGDQLPVSSGSDGGVGPFLRALSQSGSCELRSVRVQLDGKRLRMIGCVSSYYLKQLAQEALRPLASGLKIDNRLKVRSPR